VFQLVEKTKETYVLPLLNECNCVIASFDLQISKGAHNAFVLVIVFLGFDWKPKHVTLGLFRDVETRRQTLVKNLI
jgi:hypothetical protein